MPPRPAKQKLDFNEQLIQRGKAAGTDALLRRLKTLQGKLQKLDQDLVDTRSLDAVRKQLVDRVIVFHKDRGVKAHAAVCLAEILRLYAPDAPYTADELRDIFQFFIAQITDGLKVSSSSSSSSTAARASQTSKRANANADSQSQSTQTQLPSQSGSRITEVPYYTEYCALLESLASIKTVVIIVDLPSADDLITRYFNGFCDIVRSDMNKVLLRNLANILFEVLNESETVPRGVMDCIFSHFESFASKPDTPSFQLIVDVCHKAHTRLLRPIFAHFSDIQITHGRDPSPTDIQALKESHELILTMFRNAPWLLISVIPLLEENLRAVDEVPLRQLSTETLGTMFGERPVVRQGMVDLSRSYPSTWRAWLGRKVDKALQVRLAWVEATAKIIANQPELRKEIEVDLIDRIQDSDERIRAAICRVVGSLDYETALHHVSRDLLQAVGGRVSDKKPAVRSEAIDAVAKLWSLAYEGIEANDQDAIEHFGWIPQEMVMATLRKDVTADLATQIHSAIKNIILPLPTKADDEQAWVDRFLLVAYHLDANALISMDRLTGLVGYAQGSSPYMAFIIHCEKNNGGDGDEDPKTIKHRLDFIINAIATTSFHDADKARKDLDAFASAGEPRLYKLFKALVDVQSDLRTIIKSRNEFLRRIEQSHPNLLDTMSSLVDLSAWSLVNQSSIPGLIKRLQKPEGPQPERVAEVAAHYLKLIAKDCAPMYKSHVDELVIIINDKKNDALVEVGVRALAAVSKYDPDCSPTEKRTIERAMKLALEGTPKQAKFASRFISVCNDTSAPQKLVNALWAQLKKGDEDTLLASLSSLAELALSASVAFEDKSEEIVGYVLTEVMTRPSDDSTEDDTWVDEDQLPVRDQAKLYGLKLLARRALPWSRQEDAVKLVKPVLELLDDILRNEGRVNDETNEGGLTRCHMRLRAAQSMLKLANVRVYDRAMSPYFTNISFILQDVNFTVRNQFLKKLNAALPAQRLQPRWNVLPALAAQDPEEENVTLARHMIMRCVRQARSLPPEDMIDRIEIPLARLLHLLALHPDLQFTSPQELKDMSKFIELYIDCVATNQNVSLLYTIAAKLKTVHVAGEEMDENKLRMLLSTTTTAEDEDSDDHFKSPTYHLYMLSELTQIIIRNRAHQHSWTLGMYPGRVRLPSDIFANLPSPKIQQQVAHKMFLNEDVQAWAKSFGRRSHHVAGTSRRATDPSHEPRKKRRSSASGAGGGAGAAVRAPKKKRRRTSKQHESEDEESSEDDDDEDDDGTDGASASDAQSDDDMGTDGTDAEVEADGDVVMGRGGRRNAKTKAKKAVTRKNRSKRGSGAGTGAGAGAGTGGGARRPRRRRSSDAAASAGGAAAASDSDLTALGSDDDE